jgi:hypothetical protein
VTDDELTRKLGAIDAIAGEHRHDAGVHMGSGRAVP